MNNNNNNNNVTEQAHCPKPNINPKQQMRKQNQSEEKTNIWQAQQMIANPRATDTPKKTKKKPKTKTKTQPKDIW